MNEGKNEGITLVALVITIIILLILTGVSLSLIMGEDGMIGRAIGARNSNIDEGIKERITMLMDEYIIDCKTGVINENDNSQIINWLETMKQKGRMDEYSFDTDEKVIGITIDGVTLFFDAKGKEIKVLAYNINYELNGGINEENAVKTYRKGDLITLPVPTKANSQFLGWSTVSNNSDSKNIISFITPNMEGDIKLYACWIEELSADLFAYTTTATSATITGFAEKGIQKYNNGEITNLVLPSKDENGLPVTAIGVSAFLGKDKLEKLIIPETITTILPLQAFSGCSGIKYLKMPISLTYEYNNAFDGVTNIEEIYFSKGTGIGVDYLDNSSQQGHYTYTPWAKSSAKLTKITLEKGITSIGNNMFRGCSNITDTWENLINTREELTNIGSNAFCGCSKITGELTFPSQVTKINTGTFINCIGITRLIIPETITTSLPWQAFYGCSGIKYLKIPISLTYEHHNAFDGVTNIEEIYFSKGTGIGLDYLDNSSQQGHYTYTPWAKSSAKLTKITLEKGITSIGNNMFRGCSNITDTWENLINTREELTNIGSNAFCGCSKITGELTFPSQITTINTGTFVNCTGITRLIIPDTVTSNLKWQAFYGCSGIKYLKIPISLTYEHHNAFDGVTNIEEIYFSKGTGIGTNYVNDSSQQNHYTYTPWAKSSAKLTKITLEKGITSVGDRRFLGCNNITNIIFTGSSSEWAEVAKGNSNQIFTTVDVQCLE